jgi:DNA modification methylase
MKTTHTILFDDSRKLPQIPDSSVDLVVTSPPYPMIAMWDGLFSGLSPEIADLLQKQNGNDAFELMHLELDKVWKETWRVLKDGAFACINIGDATRCIGERFRLYPNHSRIISALCGLGFDCLPAILWRKQTNAPNKFMGSGMLPAGAYVTLEHEYILIFRKGAKRPFKSDIDKAKRTQSAFFWEERNTWFSDLWNFKGVPQRSKGTDLRARSAAYPFELPYRLIQMYSLANDIVFDPFIGTGTTAVAALASGRSSIGIEIDKAFGPLICDQIKSSRTFANETVSVRIADHIAFEKKYGSIKRPLKYTNEHHGFPVMTRQERNLQLMSISSIEEMTDFTFSVGYKPIGKMTKTGEISNIQTAFL